jgi:hypothetical protein
MRSHNASNFGSVGLAELLLEHHLEVDTDLQLAVASIQHRAHLCRPAAVGVRKWSPDWPDLNLAMSDRPLNYNILIPFCYMRTLANIVRRCSANEHEHPL